MKIKKLLGYLAVAAAGTAIGAACVVSTIGKDDDLYDYNEDDFADFTGSEEKEPADNN